MPATSGTRPQRISMIAIRVSGWTMRMSAAAMIWLPAPNATPWTAAITGTGNSRQPHAAYWALLAIPFVRSDRLPPALLAPGPDRKRVVEGKGVSVRVDLGGRRI